MANRLQQGDRVAARRIHTLAGAAAPVPDPDRLVHLQFRRFAGCPVCNLHLRSFVRAAPQIDGVGVREVVVFHSSADSLRVYEADLPFDVVPDPEKRLYREFGVEAHRRSLADPRAYGPVLRAIGASLGDILIRRAPVPSLDPEGRALWPAGRFPDRAVGRGPGLQVRGVRPRPVVGGGGPRPGARPLVTVKPASCKRARP